MSESVKRITIDALPASSSVSDEDIFIKSNQVETSKITAKTISDYINENSNAVQSVKIGATEYKSGTTVILPDYPTSLPASDVHDWAKAVSKPAYTASEVGADESGAANTAYKNAKTYTDSKIADLINGAPATLDTLGEIAQAMQENGDVVEALDAAIGTKANASEFDGHIKDNILHITSAERDKWNAKMEVNGDAGDVITAFSQASVRTNLSPGETLKTSLGKIMKWFADLANGAAGSLLGANLTANQVLITNESGKVTASDVTAGELDCLSGTASNVQEQLNTINTAAAAANSKLSQALYIVSFDSGTGTLTTRSADYAEG